MWPVEAAQMVELFRVPGDVVELFLAGQSSLKAHVLEDWQRVGADLSKWIGEAGGRPAKVFLAFLLELAEIFNDQIAVKREVFPGLAFAPWRAPSLWCRS